MPDRVRVDGLPDDRTVRVVHWYGGLRRNPASLHEPRLEVVLRVPKADGQSGYITREVGVTHQGLLPLGAEFTGQQQTGRIPLERADFQVDFSDQAFRIASAYDRIDGRFLIPTWQYALPDMQASQVVQFHTSEAASSLIIPCMEVFSKLYGRSRYVKQQLVKSSRFEEVLDNLIAPDVVHVPPDIGWGITLHTKCFNEDVLYVAHLKHDPVTQARTRAITRQIAAFDPRPQAPALHLKVQPWFSGPATIRVRGLWLDRQQTRFLGLQILGFSEPGGAPIFRDRQNTNLTGLMKRVQEKTRGWPQSAPRTPNKPIIVTHRLEPGHAQLPLQVDEGPLAVLGARRVVHTVRRDSTADREDGPYLTEEEIEKFSSGGPHGKKSGVGNLAVTASEFVHAVGDVLAIWETLKAMEEAELHGFQAVQALGADGHYYAYHPYMIPFEARALPVSASRVDKEWHLLEPTESLKRRCALVVHVQLEGGRGFCVVENGRRLVDVKPAPGEDDDAPPAGPVEQHFRGLMFVQNAPPDSAFIDDLLASIVECRGIMGTVIDRFHLPRANAYVHRTKDGSQREVIERAMVRIGLLAPTDT